MPFFQKIKATIKAFFQPERIIDPSKHHPEHEKYYKIAKDMQKEYDFDKKTAKKYTKKILATDRVKISERDKDIIQAHSP